MLNIAFKMNINLKMLREYKKRHNPIWQELEDSFFQHGVSSYSIFIDEQDGTLFAYAEIESRARWDAIAETDVCKRWWNYMQDLMPTNSDNSPLTVELQEIFHIQAKSYNRATHCDK